MSVDGWALLAGVSVFVAALIVEVVESVIVTRKYFNARRGR